MSATTQPLLHRGSRPHRRTIWLVTALLAAAAAIGIVVDLALRSDRSENARPDLQRVLDGLVLGRGRIAPGVAAFVSGPHGVWLGSAGIANMQTGEPMRPDARVRLESVSKLWVATLIAQLVGDGKMRLDDRVARWLPGLLPYGNRITVRQLLNHTSGMVDTNDITHNGPFYIRQVKDPRLRARLLAVGRYLEKDQGYAFSPHLWIEFAAARVSTRHDVSLLEHRVPGGRFGR
jgi:CubicO group peptidase (beta-lactamase class C family)